MTAQTKQPTHFIEVYATREGYKKYNKTKTCINSLLLPIGSLHMILHTTNVACGTLQTIAIFKIYPKNN